MEFEWDLANTSHIRRHRVKPAEAEQVLLNDPLVAQFQRHGSEKRTLVLGRTNQGRFLVVVYTKRRTKIRVVTAYPMSADHMEIYFKERWGWQEEK